MNIPNKTKLALFALERLCNSDLFPDIASVRAYAEQILGRMIYTDEVTLNAEEQSIGNTMGSLVFPPESERVPWGFLPGNIDHRSRLRNISTFGSAMPLNFSTPTTANTDTKSESAEHPSMDPKSSDFFIRPI